MFVCLFDFLTSSSTTRFNRGRAPRQERLTHMRQSWETMTSVSAGHIIQTPTQPVGSGRPQRESNPGPPHQEWRALPQSYRATRVGGQEEDQHNSKINLSELIYMWSALCYSLFHHSWPIVFCFFFLRFLMTCWA